MIDSDKDHVNISISAFGSILEYNFSYFFSNDDFILLIEISFVSSLKGGISAILASILGYFTNNQKEIKE